LVDEPIGFAEFLFKEEIGTRPQLLNKNSFFVKKKFATF